MSLVVMGGWIRSYAVFDMVSIGDQVFGSTGGCLLWYKASYESSDAFLWWHHQAAWAVAEQWNFGPGVWKFPYWVITIPLTLLSAYLILWKPQRPAQ
ncbi:MAG: hypothetical protein JWP89_5043 [Schlesneria sp.]|nr:hypothetical protein [Schlesneria sp.]